MKEYELTVVVPGDATDARIARLGEEIGYAADRHYAYGATRDVIFYVPDAGGEVERVGAILAGLRFVRAYNFDGPLDRDGPGASSGEGVPHRRLERAFLDDPDAGAGDD